MSEKIKELNKFKEKMNASTDHSRNSFNGKHERAVSNIEPFMNTKHLSSNES